MRRLERGEILLRGFSAGQGGGGFEVLDAWFQEDREIKP